MNDVVLGKAEIIERSLRRVLETYAKYKSDLDQNLDAQDIILLNLQRACEATIDLAMHLVRKNNLGLPKDSREAFTLLEGAGLISAGLADVLRKMVSFRNICVHDYRAVDWRIVRNVIEQKIKDMLLFSSEMIKKTGS
jgi:uncharacterized protein YutE (UPF0331/DUF86 family)